MTPLEQKILNVVVENYLELRDQVDRFIKYRAIKPVKYVRIPLALYEVWGEVSFNAVTNKFTHVEYVGGDDQMSGLVKEGAPEIGKGTKRMSFCLPENLVALAADYSFKKFKEMLEKGRDPSYFTLT